MKFRMPVIASVVATVLSGCAATTHIPKSCESLLAGAADSHDSSATIKVLACQLMDENERRCAGTPPNQPCGRVFVASLASKANGAHVEGHIVDVSRSGNVAGACGEVATVMLLTKGAPPMMAYAGGAVANYNCDAMLRAAARRDPIVIFGPQAVVLKEMTADGMKVAQRVADEVKRNPHLTALAGNIVLPMFQYNAVTQILAEKHVASLPGVEVDPEATLRNLQNAPEKMKEGVQHLVDEAKKLCPICG